LIHHILFLMVLPFTLFILLPQQRIFSQAILMQNLLPVIYQVIKDRMVRIGGTPISM